jgi:signal transduction histidine kinase
MTLRSYLIRLILLALLPAVCAAAATIWYAASRYDLLFYSKLQDSAKTMALAVDAEIERVRPIAQMLAESPVNDQPDGVRELYARALRLAGAYESRIWFRRAAPDFDTVFHTAFPLGTPLTQFLPTDMVNTLSRAAAERGAVLGDLGSTAFSAHSVPIVAPVERQGEIRGFVGLSLPLDRIAVLTSPERLAPLTFATVLDSSRTVVASSYGIARQARQAAPLWERADAEGRSAGVLTGIDSEGVELAVAYERVPGSPGWMVLVGAPSSVLRQGLFRALLGLSAGVACAIAIGLVGASVLARRVMASLRAALRDAGRLASPQAELHTASPEVVLRVTEFEQMRRALRAVALDRARHAEAAAREKALLQAVVEGTGDAIWIQRLDGPPVLLNDAARALGGDADATKLQAAAAEPVERVLAEGAPQTRELTLPDADGALLTHLALFSPWYGEDGALLGVIAIARDMTSKLQGEKRLAEAQQQLQHLARRVTSEAMASGVAHELSQPLASLGAFAGVALAHLNRPDGQSAIGDARNALRRVLAQLDRAGAIVANLRGFVGRSDVLPEPVDLADIVHEAVALAIAGTPASPNVPVSVDVEGDVPQLSLRKVAVQQVVVNLVRNAIEAVAPMPDGPERRVSVTLRGFPVPHMVEIEVADGGPGLSEEVRSRLFEPFVSTKSEGMGVGLSICRTIVEAHGGRISAVPREGGGTVFRFTLSDASAMDAAA